MRGLAVQQEKIAFRNFKNSLMLIYTFRFEKLKIRRLSDAKIGENTLKKKLKILPKAIEKIEP